MKSVTELESLKQIRDTLRTCVDLLNSLIALRGKI